DQQPYRQILARQQLVRRIQKNLGPRLVQRRPGQVELVVGFGVGKNGRPRGSVMNNEPRIKNRVGRAGKKTWKPEVAGGGVAGEGRGGSVRGPSRRGAGGPRTRRGVDRRAPRPAHRAGEPGRDGGPQGACVAGGGAS